MFIQLSQPDCTDRQPQPTPRDETPEELDERREKLLADLRDRVASGEWSQVREDRRRECEAQR